MESVNVYEAIESERRYQDRKWGTVEQHPHEVGAWLTLMRKHLSDAESVFAGFDNAFQNLRYACAGLHYSRARVEFEPCAWAFKSRQCGYFGAETTCDKSPNSCRAKGRFSNFSGLPGETMNYELLRPFDLEAAKAGAKITDGAFTFSFVAEAGDDGNMAVRFDWGNIALLPVDRARMVPLAWVEGKPVYPGDVLYWNDTSSAPGSKFTAENRPSVSSLVMGSSTTTTGATYTDGGMYAAQLTWNKSKVRKEGWINVYPKNGSSKGKPVTGGQIHPTKAVADKEAFEDRVACVRIEWEE